MTKIFDREGEKGGALGQVVRMESHIADGHLYLVWQLRNKQIFLSILDSFLTQVQGLEDATHLLRKRVYDLGSDASLDDIASFFRITRSDGQSDADLRNELAIAVLTTRSKGRASDLKALVDQWTGTTSARIIDGGYASVRVLTGDASAWSNVLRLVEYLRRAKVAGVQLFVELSVPDQMLCDHASDPQVLGACDHAPDPQVAHSKCGAVLV